MFGVGCNKLSKIGKVFVLFCYHFSLCLSIQIQTQHFVPNSIELFNIQLFDIKCVKCLDIFKTVYMLKCIS